MNRVITHDVGHGMYHDAGFVLDCPDSLIVENVNFPQGKKSFCHNYCRDKQADTFTSSNLTTAAPQR
jgi:hypothetical protein